MAEEETQSSPSTRAEAPNEQTELVSDKADTQPAEAEASAAEPSAATQEGFLDVAPAAATSFDEWEIADSLRKALDAMGYERPMPVQEAVFKSLTAGRDMMVQSKTGSGKTSAFGIPIAQLLSEGKKGVQALILAPTRELALQVAKEVSKLVAYMDVSVVPVYGGAAIGPQIQKLEDGGQIVAGTPGRVLDHIRRGTLDTSGIRLLTLDECDEMLSMGFQEEIENIIKTLPKKEERQTLLFSATIPKEIERIGRRHMREPEMLSLSSDSVGAELIDHYYYVVSGMARTRDLLKLMKAERPESAIIFCNTREETNTVARYLCKNGYDAEALSSDLSQKDRERVMGRMRDKNLNFLVATDIAARGIDISELGHVINYTFPSSPEVYVHRSGRTGRAGKQGVALSLVGPREIGAFYYLKLIYKIIPTERELPSADEMATIEEGEKYREVVARLEGKGKQEFRSLARRVWQSSEGERVFSLLLEELMKGNKKAHAPAVEPSAGLEAEGGEAHTINNDSDSQGGREDSRDGRRRRRRRRDRGEGGHRDRNFSPSESEHSEDGTDAQLAEVPASLSAPASEESKGDDSRDGRRRKRRRRKGGHRKEEEDFAPVDASAVWETPDPKKEQSPEADSSSEESEKSANTSEPEDGALVSQEADFTESPESDGENAESNLLVDDARSEADESVHGDEGRDSPKRKKRRRRRSYRESEASEPSKHVEHIAAAPLPELRASKADKRRTREERRDPGEHAEFWEVWADGKSEEKSTEEDAKPKPREKKARKAKATTPGADAKDGGTESARSESSASAEEEKPGKRVRSVRLFVNVGKREDTSVDEIREFLSEALGDTADELGRITLRNSHTYLRVPENIADEVIETCNGLVFRERAMVVERARR